MSLAAAQQDFLDGLVSTDARLPEGWSERHAAGMEVYRNAYRTRLIDTLADMFERTARWVGEEPFKAAAAHHAITHPPTSWTLDHAGEGFDMTLSELFAGDPEVAELAWLEGTMTRVFVAENAEPLDGEGFAQATAGFAEQDWAEMRLSLLPGLTQRAIVHDLPGIWRAMGLSGGAEAEAPENYTLETTQHCVVWREREEPVFQLVDADQGAALLAIQSGANYAEMCGVLAERVGEEAAAECAGAMLAGWLRNGWVSRVGGRV